MTRGRPCLLAWLIVIGLATSGFAQKVKVEYDKSADFTKFKTYTWAKPQMPTTRPLLYETVVAMIDDQLKAKGFERTEKDGDLTLIAAGGIEYGSNLPVGTPILPIYGGPPPSINATMWTGAEGPGGMAGPVVAQGTLVLEFVHRTENKVIWSGAVIQKLDPERRTKSLSLAEKAVVKLLKKFPPDRSSK